jgi:protein-tyrosine phosphatase
MAEGIFSKKVLEKKLKKKFQVDSAGTSAYHIGCQADIRMRQTAAFHDIELTSKARQVNASDFEQYDYIVAMDSSNYTDLLELQPKGSKSEVLLMRQFDEKKDDDNVPDPYFGGQHGFEEVYQILNRSLEQFLDYVITQKSMNDEE